MLDARTRQHWIEELASFDEWNERIFAAIFASFGRVENYLDVGCGTGAMVNLARSMGIDAVGLDQIGPLHGEDHLLVHDLRESFTLPTTFDLVSCLEVAEHIEPKYADTLVQSISEHQHTGSILIWSAAGPGQDGTDHLNCQLGSYWRDKFHARGISYRFDYTQRLQVMLLASQHPLADHLIGNLQVFDK